jgi:hypothetical protein
MTSFWTPYFDPTSRKQEIIQVYSVKQPPENTQKNPEMYPLPYAKSTSGVYNRVLFEKRP